MLNDLTCRDFEVFATLERIAISQGEMPTFAEIADGLGIDMIQAIRHLRRLRDGGFVDWEPERPRSFRVIRRPTTVVRARMGIQQPERCKPKPR